MLQRKMLPNEIVFKEQLQIPIDPRTREYSDLMIDKKKPIFCDHTSTKYKLHYPYTYNIRKIDVYFVE